MSGVDDAGDPRLKELSEDVERNDQPRLSPEILPGHERIDFAGVGILIEASERQIRQAI
jgi:hypothetical protein